MLFFQVGKWKVQISIFLKKRLQRRCFCVNIAQFFRTPFFAEHLLVTAFEQNDLLVDIHTNNSIYILREIYMLTVKLQ